jgi:hypothetical protein
MTATTAAMIRMNLSSPDNRCPAPCSTRLRQASITQQVLKPSEGAHIKSMSNFETDEHLQELTRAPVAHLLLCAISLCSLASEATCSRIESGTR